MLSMTSGHRRQRGLSVVELLVGVAVGLLILGGASKVFVDYLVANRGMLVETRVNQDLRAAADLIVRDLRRASYWADASSGMVAPAAASAPLNPFRDITVSNQDLTAGELLFSYDRPTSTSEPAGFRVRNGALEMKLGTSAGADNWQAVTDTGAVQIDVALLNAPVLRTVDLFSTCPCIAKLACTAADFAVGATQYATRPRLTVRQYTLRLSGFAPGNSSVRREIRETVRVRNDNACGVCPDSGSVVPSPAPVCS
jgi:type IV pilus assembly protein PilW